MLNSMKMCTCAIDFTATDWPRSSARWIAPKEPRPICVVRTGDTNSPLEDWEEFT